VSLRVIQTPESLADIALQADYYAQRETITLAERYTDAVKATVRLLADQPGIGRPSGYAHPRLAGIRLYPVRKPFDIHLIFYRFSGETLDIVRVIHRQRDLPRCLLDPPGAE
jgi:plasmid stabilization system protein ParE